MKRRLRDGFERHRLIFITALITFAIVVVGFTSVELKYNFIKNNAEESEPNKSLERFYYNYLTYREQELYDALYDTIDAGHDQSRVLPYRYERYELEKIVNAFSADYPEIFCIDRNSITLEANRTKSILKINYLFDKDFIDEYTMILDDAVELAVSEVLDDATELGLELHLHDYLAEICTFDVENDTFASTAYGALVHRKATAEGYAKAFKLLCDRYGLSSFVVYGEASGEKHAWNKVYIGGDYYNVDVMWNDADLDFAPNLLFHGYFNLSDDVFFADHTPDQPSLFPECNGKDDYYTIKGLKVGDIDTFTFTVKEQIALSYQNENDCIEICADFPIDDREINSIVSDVIAQLNSEGVSGYSEVCRILRASSDGSALTIQLFRK